MIDNKVIMDIEAEKAIKANMAGNTSLAARVAALEAKVPAATLPTEAGSYKLVVTVDGDVITYSWVALA